MTSVDISGEKLELLKVELTNISDKEMTMQSRYVTVVTDVICGSCIKWNRSHNQ